MLLPVDPRSQHIFKRTDFRDSDSWFPISPSHMLHAAWVSGPTASCYIPIPTPPSHMLHGSHLPPLPFLFRHPHFRPQIIEPYNSLTYKIITAGMNKLLSTLLYQILYQGKHFKFSLMTQQLNLAGSCSFMLSCSCSCFCSAGSNGCEDR